MSEKKYLVVNIYNIFMFFITLLLKPSLLISQELTCDVMKITFIWLISKTDLAFNTLVKMVTKHYL